MKKIEFKIPATIKNCIVLIFGSLLMSCNSPQSVDPLKQVFQNPPDSAKPGVYWYFMDGNLSEDGRLVWDAPAGEWTIIRMGKRVTGASTRPAPEPALGWESNKMDTLTFRNHLRNYTDFRIAGASANHEC